MKQSVWVLVGCLLALDALAHDARPIYVQVQETTQGSFSVQWNAPPTMPLRALPTPALPAGCKATDDPVVRQTSAGYVASQIHRCSGGLSGQPLGIHFPSINPSLTTLFQVRLASGEQHFRVLKPGGRIVISDMVSDLPVPAVLQGNVDAAAGCLPTFREAYIGEFADAGFDEVRITSEKPYPADYLLTDPGVIAFLEEHPAEADDLRAFAGSIAGAHFEAHKPA